MNKICTTIEQSKKLIELGIDVNTADMIYQPTMDIDSMSNVGFVKIPLCFSFNEVKECNVQYLPCWSLTALLNALPQTITKYIEDERCQKTFHLNLFRSYYHCVSYSFTPSVNDDNTLYCIGGDTWVDACYKMILKLNELKML